MESPRSRKWMSSSIDTLLYATYVGENAGPFGVFLLSMLRHSMDAIVAIQIIIWQA
jgi:hypothetical protein